jgi:hypothetical protein
VYLCAVTTLRLPTSSRRRVPGYLCIVRTLLLLYGRTVEGGKERVMEAPGGMTPSNASPINTPICTLAHNSVFILLCPLTSTSNRQPATSNHPGRINANRESVLLRYKIQANLHRLPQSTCALLRMTRIRWSQCINPSIN